MLDIAVKIWGGINRREVRMNTFDGKIQLFFSAQKEINRINRGFFFHT